MYRSYKVYVQSKTGNVQSSLHLVDGKPNGPPNDPVKTTSTKANDGSDVAEWKAKQQAELAALKKQAEDLEAMLLGQLKKMEERGVKKPDKKTLLLNGNVKEDYPTNSRIVRIFTSSTFTDTTHERNALMERVYPKLRQYCKNKGYEFQVVDMRWGIRDESTDDHMTTELCLNELHACQKLSTGPAFVTFLSHKYGYRPLQRVIKEAEFQQLLDVITADEDKSFLEKWYKLDINMEPPARVLQPISTHFPDFVIRGDQVRYQQAKKEWWAESQRIFNILRTAAKNTLSLENAQKYIMSVTEREITDGLLESTGNETRSLWFKRNIAEIDNQPPSRLLSRYKDIETETQSEDSAQKLLSALKEDKIPKALPAANIHEFEVKWTENAIDPDSTKEHREYIDKFCLDFEESMLASIDNAIAESSSGLLSNKLYEEILSHINFCKEKCAMFHGRKELLKDISSALRGKKPLPFVLYGNSGCGKTSLMACIARDVKSWILRDATVVLRFIGTTPQSTDKRNLLLSITKQINEAYNIKDTAKDAESLNDTQMAAYFKVALLRVSKTKLATVRPLVILLDSLDQLSNQGNPQGGYMQYKYIPDLDWLLGTLPPNIFVIISTLPDTDAHKYGYLPKLQTKYQAHQDRFLSVPNIDFSDAKEIISNWLSVEKRKLTDEQFEVVLKAFDHCRLPLFLKLCFDEAVQWSSFTKVNENQLATSVEGAINSVFSSMERKHGFLVASRTFSYITASKSGLSEVELEDILSCDDDVLNDVYQYWTPPIRRLPPLLLVRLKTDMSQYLAERGSTSGVKLIYWYHRQFIETARQRYLFGEHVTIPEKRLIHKMIAEYFLGKWAQDVSKPYTDKNGEHQTTCRYVTPQPLTTKDGINMRKLEELPMHLTLADRFTELSDNIILNFDWHMTQLKTNSFRGLIEDIEFALEHTSTQHDLSEWEMMRDVLRRSEEALYYDAELLPSQVLGRIGTGLTDYRKQCMAAQMTKLFPTTLMLTPPSGELLFTLAGHTKDMLHAVMTVDKAFVLTSNEDNTVRMWDIEKGKETQIFSVGSSTDENISISSLFLCCADKYVVVTFFHTNYWNLWIHIFDTKTGILVHKVRQKFDEICPIFNDQTHLVVINARTLTLFNVLKGELESESIKAPEADNSNSIFVAGSHNIFCIVSEDRFLYIYDMAERKQVHCIEVAKKAKKEEDDWFPDLVALTPSGGTVVTLASIDNNLHVFDTATGLRKSLLFGVEEDNIQTGYFVSESIFLCSQGTRNRVLVWDIEADQRRYLIPHETSIVKALATKDLKTFVTVACESVVNVWKPKELPAPGNDDPTDSTAVKFDKEDILAIITHPESSRYILLTSTLSFNDKKRDPFGCLKLFDVHDHKVVRIMFVSHLIRSVVFLNASEVILLDRKEKLHHIDIDAQELIKTFQGFTGGHTFAIRNFEPVHGLICLTKYNINVKILDISSGTTKAIVKTGVKKCLEPFLLVSKNGCIGVFQEDLREQEEFVVVCFRSQQVIHRLKDEDYPIVSYSDPFITSDGRYFLHSTYDGVRGIPQLTTSFALVWDLKTGICIGQIYDKTHPTFERIAKEKKEIDCDHLDCCEIKAFEKDGSSFVAMATNNNTINVFEMISGRKIHSFSTKHTQSITYMIVSEKINKYCMSTSNGDNSLWLYEIDNDWNKMACFKTDQFYTKHVFVDEFTIAMAEKNGSEGEYAEVAVLRLYTGAETGPIPAVTLQVKEEEINIALPEVDKKVPEEFDPDLDDAPSESDDDMSDEDVDEDEEDDVEEDDSDDLREDEGDFEDISDDNEDDTMDGDD